MQVEILTNTENPVFPNHFIADVVPTISGGSGFDIVYNGYIIRTISIHLSEMLKNGTALITGGYRIVPYLPERGCIFKNN